MMCLPAGLGTVALGSGGGGGGEVLPTAFNMSSVYVGLACTTTNMRDGDYTTGGGTNSLSINEWIEADLGSSQYVGHIEVAGGNIPGWGPVASYLNGRTVQYWDGSTWQTLPGTISGATDSGTFVTTFAVGVSASKFRIYSTGYVATTEFRFFP